MEEVKKISIEQCCIYYKIEASFVQELNEHGLIELTRSDKEAFIAYEQLGNLEKYMHLHYDLEINMPGMEAISHLLSRLQTLQQEIKKLQGGLEHD